MFVWDERMDLAFSEDYHRGKGEGFEEGKKKGISEGIVEGKKIGIAEGKELGIVEAKKEMIIKLNDNGVSRDIISNATGLSKEEIEKIISV